MWFQSACKSDHPPQKKAAVYSFSAQAAVQFQWALNLEQNSSPFPPPPILEEATSVHNHFPVASSWNLKSALSVALWWRGGGVKLGFVLVMSNPHPSQPLKCFFFVGLHQKAKQLLNEVD